jgi:hypothetical protein
MGKAFKEVFRRPAYLALALSIALLAFVFSVWMPNLGLIVRSFGTLPLSDALRLATALLGGIRTNFSVFSRTYTIAVDLLLGINIALIVYAFRRFPLLSGQGVAGTSAMGILSGILGIGCATCGSIVAIGFLSLVGASGVIAILPLKGGEFGIVSIILLSTSIILISRKITTPLICEPIIK